jgi:hypothetical protein
VARNWPNNAANRIKDGNNNINPVGGHMTLSCWAKLTSVIGNSTFMSRYDGSAGPLLRISGATNNKLGFFIIDATAGQTGHEAIGATTLTTGVWLHLAATWNGNNTTTGATLGCWLNGVRDGTTTSSGQRNQSDTTNGWTYGARGTANFPQNGDLCEFAIWSEDLSAGTSTSDEILALARGTSPLLIRRNKLMVYRPTFGSFDNQIDFSGGVNLANGGGNNGVLVGTLNTAAGHAPVAQNMPDYLAGFPIRRG